MWIDIRRHSAKRLGNGGQVLVRHRPLGQGAQDAERLHQFLGPAPHSPERCLGDAGRGRHGTQLRPDLLQDVFNEVQPEHRKLVSVPGASPNPVFCSSCKDLRLAPQIDVNDDGAQIP